jgi:uncharacterized protein YjgD (DUF1641 family)
VSTEKGHKNLKMNQRDDLTEERLLLLVENMDKLGLIDVLNGMLSDPDFVESVVTTITGENVLLLATRASDLLKLINSVNLQAFTKLMNLMEKKPGYEYALQRLIELVEVLDKRGLLDLTIGALGDEKTFSSVMNVLSKDESFKLIENFEPMIGLLSSMDYQSLNTLTERMMTEKQLYQGLFSLTRLLGAMESRGLIDPIVGALYDEKTFSYIAKQITSDSFLSIVTNSQSLMELMVSIDPVTIQLLSQILKTAKDKEVEPVKGLFSTMRILSDDEVSAGMGKIWEIIRVLGRTSS